MPLHPTRVPVALLVAAAACGGGSSADPGPDPNVIRVGGEYATAVTLGESTCPGIVVQSMPTTVAHAAGATTLTLTHAGNAYAGTLQRDGAFATTPRAVGGGGETHTLAIAGRFTRAGLDATVTADVLRDAAPRTCRYVVRWVGTKQGAPNVIPGA
jgi:hypothetical protein